MEVYNIKYKNNCIGIYDNLTSSLDYIYSLVSSKLVNENEKIFISKYKLNTCIILDEYEIDLKYNITKQQKINYTNTIYEINSDTETTTISDKEIFIKKIKDEKETTSTDSSKERLIKEKNKEFITKYTELGQARINLTQQLNQLNKEKSKLEEEQNKYQVDLNLYKKFSNLKKTSNFEIPFMFVDKYSVFETLDQENKLTFENVQKIYKPSQIDTSYSHLFDTTICETFSNSDIEEYNNVSDNELLLTLGQKNIDTDTSYMTDK